MPDHNTIFTGKKNISMPQWPVLWIIAFALSLPITDAAFAQRPSVQLEKCNGMKYSIGCNARLCLKVRTEEWEHFPKSEPAKTADPGSIVVRTEGLEQPPESVQDAPEVYIQFSRKIRDQEGQPLPFNRFKVSLDKGSDHDKTLWFQTDDGPLFLAFVDFTARLKKASLEDLPFDIASGEAVWRMSGDACRKWRW